jgi:SNF2 family DNA or RNA helicase
MTGDQLAAYVALRDDYLALIDGEKAPKASDVLREYGVEPVQQNEKTVGLFDAALGGDLAAVALLATTLQVRLHQVTSGHIKTNDGEVRMFESNCKGEWMRDNLPALAASVGGHKTIWMTCFKPDVAYLSKLCDELGLGYVSLSGKNSDDAEHVIEQFWKDKNKNVFIGNMAVASASINLQCADTLGFYSCSFNGEHRQQAYARAYRMGQKHRVRFFDLLAVTDTGRQTVDRLVLQNQAKKVDLGKRSVRGLRETLREAIGEM